MPTACLRLYAHRFSSYCQKALIALYENRTAFDYRNLEDAQANEELTALWPMRTQPTTLAGEGDENLGPTVVADHAGKAVFVNAAVEEGEDGLLDDPTPETVAMLEALLPLALDLVVAALHKLITL